MRAHGVDIDVGTLNRCLAIMPPMIIAKAHLVLHEVHLEDGDGRADVANVDQSILERLSAMLEYQLIRVATHLVSRLAAGCLGIVAADVADERHAGDAHQETAQEATALREVLATLGLLVRATLGTAAAATVAAAIAVAAADLDEAGGRKDSRGEGEDGDDGLELHVDCLKSSKLKELEKAMEDLSLDWKRLFVLWAVGSKLWMMLF